MTRFGLEHILTLMATVLFLALTSYAVSKMRMKWQNYMFTLAAVLCSVGIFFHYAMGLSFDFSQGLLSFDFKELLLQMLEIRNLNFILLPLMLIPKCHPIKQYVIYFSSFVTAATLIFIPVDWAAHEPYSAYIINLWLSYTFAVACPLWMLASKRARPERKYIIPVTVCVFIHFTAVYLISEALISAGVITAQDSFSLIYNADGVPLINLLHSLIKLPYFYLYPLFPILVAFFILFAFPFNKSLRFDANGGEGIIKQRTVPIHSLTQLPWRGISREGYRLIGWSLNPQSETPEYETGGGFIMKSCDTVLYAVWEPWGIEQADVEDHAHYKEETWGVSCNECIMREHCDSVGHPDAMCNVRCEEYSLQLSAEAFEANADSDKPVFNEAIVDNYSSSGEAFASHNKNEESDEESFFGVDFEALNREFVSGAMHSADFAEPTDEELAAMNPDFNEEDFENN